MFSNKIDTYTPVKDDKLKSQTSQNFDFEGEGFSSMLEKDETLTGKLRETEAEIREDESILSTDEENQAIAKRRTQAKAEAEKQIQKETSKPEVDARNLLKLMDISTKINPVHISKSKKELENITGAVSDNQEELVGIVTKVLQEAQVKEDHQDEAIKTTIDLSTSEEKMSDSKKSKKEEEFHETQEELLEDMSILSTDEENLAMARKNSGYSELSDEDFSHNGEEDMELLSEIVSIHNQSRIEVSNSSVIKSAENVMAQIIEESKSKLVKLDVSELSSEDVDYITNLLKQGTADFNFDEKENPSALSAKFLSMLKETLTNKKVFRIDFDNEISVIIKIDVEGKISANFLTSSKELEENLKNNLYILRQKFEEQGIKYDKIEHTSTHTDDAQLDMQEVINTIKSAGIDTKVLENKN